MSHLPATWDETVDLLCVGSGLGAVTAALAAHDAGLAVALVEKSDKLGGVCAYSGGEVFVPGNHVMESEGAPDDDDAAWAYLSFLAGGYADDRLARKLFSHGRAAARWLGERAGVPWKTIANFPDYHHPRAPGTVGHGRYLEVPLFDGASLGPWQRKTWAMSPHMPPGITHDELFAWGSISCALTWDYGTMGARIAADQRGFGPGMMGWLLKAALVDRQIPAHVQTPVQALAHSDGRVVGARCERAGEDYWIHARKGVLLSIGGYDHNPRLARYYEGLPEWQSACQPTVEGDNILLGGEVGAELAGVPPYNLGMFFGYHIPGEQHAGKPLWRASWEGGYPHALWVNQAGKRFCDESFYRQYLPAVHSWDGERQRHPNFPPYLVFDAQYRERYFFATFLPGQPIKPGMVEQADTPGALADKLGIHRANFEATLARFNSFADGPEDPDFGRGTYPWAAMMIGDRTRPNPNLGPVSKPPFYGIRLTPIGVGINAVGLRTNDMAQVMHVRGHPIEGLWACGNSAAALDTGAGYQSGLSNLRGMTWGWIAGHHAAGIEV